MLALPRYSSTSIPPATRTYARSPAPSSLPTSSTAPAASASGSQVATGSPSTVGRHSAPVTITVVGAPKRSRGPTIVHSRPAAPSSLPSAQFPSRKERSSIGPEGGTPTRQRPTRPGQSWTVVIIPGARTSSVALSPGETLTGG